MLIFTDRARDMLATFLGQGEGDRECLRLGRAGSPMAPEFELTLVGAHERREDERQVDADGITVLLAEAHADALDGATVDFVERVNESGFEVRPVQKAAAAAPPAPSGPVAERVREVLDEQVNPAIASHGGAISLVDVQGTEIYLEMSGGCQGCAMSRLTLRQGVERMLRQAIPELSAVHDITDHAGGSNPYFEA